jgi:hypothetical protein
MATAERLTGVAAAKLMSAVLAGAIRIATIKGREFVALADAERLADAEARQ